MIAATQFTKAALMLNEAQEKISEMLGIRVLLHFEVETRQSMTVGNIIRVVSQVSGISASKINSKSRAEEVCYARYVCWFLMQKYLGMTKSGIGRYFGRDHTTIINGLDVIEHESTNVQLRELLLKSEETFLKEIRNENKI